MSFRFLLLQMYVFKEYNNKLFVNVYEKGIIYKFNLDLILRLNLLEFIKLRYTQNNQKKSAIFSSFYIFHLCLSIRNAR